MAVCCGNCKEQISADFLAIRCLMLKCWHLNLITTVPRGVKRDRLGLYRRLRECGECGCYC